MSYGHEQYAEQLKSNNMILFEIFSIIFLLGYEKWANTGSMEILGRNP